jgi:DNA-binding transcriptional LysR family regulator
MIDLYKLEIFARVVEAGSFSKAAANLYMSQSGVSQHMQELEAGLGTVLFNRGRRGVTLTPPGQTLYDFTCAILRLVAEATAKVTDVVNLRSGQITIGATPGVSGYLLPCWVQAFQQQFPNLSVSIQTAVTPQIIADLRARTLDLGVIEGEIDPDEPDRLEVVALQAVNQLVIVGRQHAWWKRSSVPLTALDGQPFVMRQAGSQTRIWLDQMLEQYDITPHIVAEFDNPESIKRMVSASQSITILPEYAVQDEQALGLVRAIPIEQHPLQRTLKLAWNSALPFAPVSRAFLLHLGATFPVLQELLGEETHAGM